jgi:peptide/nickel transport system ATP-binding protein
MSELLLNIRNLVTEFRTDEEAVKAVNDISFSVNKGETIGIVGESGSGKSVTALSVMRLIASPPGRIVSGEMNFQSPSKGEVDLARLDDDAMRQIRGNEIAMIFQEPMTSLNPVFTCGSQVAEAIMLHQKVNRKTARNLTLQLFEKVKLPRPDSLFDTYPHQISGGQKQRVMIAMAMSCNPSILIADEPTTALDVTVQATILDLMRQLQQETGMAILFITHDLGVVAELADSVVVMNKGRILEQGSVADIFSAPRHPYTRGLLACRPPLDKKLYRLPTISDFMNETADGTFTETDSSVKGMVGKYEITRDDILKQRDHLYKAEPVLKVSGVKTWFPIRKGLFSSTTGYVKAVDDVSFEVYPGETLGLVGESGCGKTTLGRTILRLVEPTGGSIEFEGRDITRLQPKQLRDIRKDIQIIFQDPYSSLNPRITIGDAITEPMKVHGLYMNARQRKDKAMELLGRVNMKESHFNRYPHEFSGGQRQRVCIARALSLNPRFIICDESVSALDVSIQAQVLNLLNELRETFNFTYIFISHDLSVVKFMSDRMIVMNKGKIEEMGFADEVYHNPQTDYTRRLIAAIPKGGMEDIRRSQQKKSGTPQS